MKIGGVISGCPSTNLGPVKYNKKWTILNIQYKNIQFKNIQKKNLKKIEKKLEK